MTTTTDHPTTAPPPDRTALATVLRDGAVRTVFQPIVDLATGSVVAYEALSRGPQGPLESPLALFGTARATGLLAELDEACRSAAFRNASEHGLVAPLTVFVNVEPEVLDGAPLTDLLAIADHTPGGLRIVLEITERALAARPAELLSTVQRVRDLGWGVALDDVGSESASLAFMSLLCPDVVKLDLSLVQEQASPAIAEIMNAVNAYAERSGALVLAEGIETEQHLTVARALGATLGQGWLFGRPTASPEPTAPARGLPLTPSLAPVAGRGPGSPFACLPAGTVLRRSPKRLLVELSKQLEREAMRIGETCVVGATFQLAQHFTASTALRYRDLVERTGFVCALGEGLPEEPVPGVRGATLAEDDPVVGEWDVAVLSPHFSAALLARDLGDSGPDMDRMFEYALTYRRDVVTRAAVELLSRVDSSRTRVVAERTTAVPPTPATVLGELPLGTTLGSAGDALVRRALAATTSGVTIADMTRPDQPLVLVNAAFERLAGFPSSDLVDRNCRVLQGPDTDRAAVDRMRAAIAAGEEVRETMLNYRGVDRVPWWNEVHLSPVLDADGRVVQYIGVQNDVTERVEAERALVRERDLGRSYLARIEQLAYVDSLTGLMNRRRFEERIEAALLDARMEGTALALLFIDLDGFKAVNDSLGHTVGDRLLELTARRLRERVRGTDLLARLGGDEFLVAMTGLDPLRADAESQSLAEQLAAVMAQPARLGGQDVQVSASIGISIRPTDAEDFGRLFHLADMRMYQLKYR